MQHQRRQQHPHHGSLDAMNESIHSLNLNAGRGYANNMGSYQVAESDVHSDMPLMMNSNDVSVDDLDYDGVEVETALREPPLLIRWEGYLMKRSDWLKHWETYYFVLHGRVLYCYLSDEEAKLHPENSKIKHGKFTFSDNLILDEVITVQSRLTYEFVFESDKGKQIHLRAKTEASKQMWMHMACHGIVDTEMLRNQVLHMRRTPQRHATLVDFFLGYEYLFASLSNIEDATASTSSLDSSNKQRKHSKQRSDDIVHPDAAIAAFAPKVDHILCRFFSMCQTDIAMRNNYMPMVPFQGTFRGYAGVLEYFTKLSKAVSFESFSVEGMSFEGDETKRLVVVHGLESMEVRGTGQSFSQAWEHKFLVKDDGRIYRWEINGDIVASSVAFKHLHNRGHGEKYCESFTTIKLDNIPNLARKDKPIPPTPTKPPPRMAWNTPPQQWDPPPTTPWSCHHQSFNQPRHPTPTKPQNPPGGGGIHIQLRRTYPSSSSPTHTSVHPVSSPPSDQSSFEDRMSTFLDNDQVHGSPHTQSQVQDQRRAPPTEASYPPRTSFRNHVTQSCPNHVTGPYPLDDPLSPTSFYEPKEGPPPLPVHHADPSRTRHQQQHQKPPSSSFRPSTSSSDPSFPQPPRPFPSSASFGTRGHSLPFPDNHHPRFQQQHPPSPPPQKSPDAANLITSSTSFDYPLGFKRGNLWPDAPVPPSENIRLAAAKRLDLCRPREDLAMYLQIACKTLHVSMGTVCVVGGGAGLFIAKFGGSMTHVDTAPRDMILESHVIMSADPTVVLDTSVDIRFAMNPVVTQGDVGFYVGIPLVSTDGDYDVVVGALSLVDTTPRDAVTHKQVAALVQIAQTIMHRVQDLSAAGNGARNPPPPPPQHDSTFDRTQVNLEID
ncbi:hypothetical protein H257_09270 [Aphanomyces astaci]|uniref:PH domain-containing protein n=2 Tax=Aphanomyces astaci TaxID=112090 RepID=W4GCY8_APHAT|nr:hypothetical protein H257_09270 [Aphanomyces astaci]ETV76823.1 hypothetical protein H257_09270 [Aphanomyces astaci]|eukprot:XP_009833735.1 hypothetical protein H257_09270 [Aphanomyces astaci]